MSSISRDGRRAFVAAGAGIFMPTLAPLLVVFQIVGPNSAWALGLASLPSAGPLLTGVTDGGYAAAAGPFWRTLFTFLLSSVLLLALASALLPRCWQERGPAESRTRWLPRRWLERWGTWFRGRARRRRMLDSNPILWLTERTALNAWATQAFWTLSLAVWVAGLVALRNRSLPSPVVFGATYVLHLAVKCWVAWEASRRFSEDKRSGALELLLTTELSERTILVGWLLGLKRCLLLPILMVFALDAHLWWKSDNGEWLLGMVAAVGLFIADTYTLCWVGLWIGLNARNSIRAFLATIGRVLILPWFALLAAFGVWGLLAQGNPLLSEPGWLAMIWFLGGYALDVGLCAWGIHKLSDGLRLAAPRHFEPVQIVPKRGRLKPVFSRPRPSVVSHK